MKKLWSVIYGEVWDETYAVVMAYCATSALELAGGLSEENPKVKCLGLYHSEDECIEPHVVLKCKSLNHIR